MLSPSAVSSWTAAGCSTDSRGPGVTEIAMDGPLVAPALIAGAVFVIALLYASVGHAGATGYIAMMTLAGLTPDVIRPTALLLNVVVATIATVQFARAGHFRGRLFWPLSIASVPCAAIGGAVKLPTQAFETLLGVVLLVSAARLVREAVAPRGGDDDPESSANSPIGLRWLLPLGGGIGMLSGLTGVGGGVFLTPVLAWLRAAPVRRIAAVTAPFILLNSLAGLAGGLVAGRPFPLASGWLVAAAAAGGLAGSQLGAFRLPTAAIRLLMAAVLLVATAKLLVLP